MSNTSSDKDSDEDERKSPILQDDQFVKIPFSNNSPLIYNNNLNSSTPPYTNNSVSIPSNSNNLVSTPPSPYHSVPTSSNSDNFSPRSPPLNYSLNSSYLVPTPPPSICSYPTPPTSNCSNQTPPWSPYSDISDYSSSSRISSPPSLIVSSNRSLYVTPNESDYSGDEIPSQLGNWSPNSASTDPGRYAVSKRNDWTHNSSPVDLGISPKRSDSIPNPTSGKEPGFELGNLTTTTTSVSNGLAAAKNTSELDEPSHNVSNSNNFGLTNIKMILNKKHFEKSSMTSSSSSNESSDEKDEVPSSPVTKRPRWNLSKRIYHDNNNDHTTAGGHFSGSIPNIIPTNDNDIQFIREVTVIDLTVTSDSNSNSDSDSEEDSDEEDHDEEDEMTERVF